ncbi:MAG: CapA family protein, partial [Muribaculaceae bacterium]|nr:CapA family protein [Muribaculaceae bacterium]
MTSLGTILILLLSLLQSVWGEQEISLLFAGDAMQHGPQIDAARRAKGAFDYSSCFTFVEDDIKAADYAVVNLECPLGGAPYSGYPAFSAPDAFARQLSASGFDLLLTANNHCLDRRDAGLRRTITVLDSLQIPHTGTFLSSQHRSKV